MSADTFRELALLCAQLTAAEQRVAEAEQALKDRKKEARTLAEEDIPGLMSELGLAKLVLDSGETVSVSLEVYASIPVANREAAMKWLADNGHGALIDLDVNVHYSREKRDEGLVFYQELSGKGLDPELSEGVNAARLKSFIKEQLEASQPVPLELFGARSVKEAKVKKPRAR